MMRLYALIGLILLFCLPAETKAEKRADGKYPIYSIPAKLLPNANAVVRESKEVLEILDRGTATYTSTKAVTVLNKHGKEEAEAVIFYDDLIRLGNISGAVYDANGKQIKRLSKSDFQDYSAISGISLYEDNRVRHYEYESSSYPYTVEISYDVTYKGTLFLPGWSPMQGEKVAVEHAEYTVTYNPEHAIKFKERNVGGARTEAEVKGKKVITWELTNLEWSDPDPYGPYWAEINPNVKLAMQEFEVAGYEGSNRSWQELGQWYYELNKGRDILPEEARLRVKRLTSGITDPREKIEVLYNYLQKNTRYVSIQLGIGGWQTFEASVVEDKGYGDCKALTNYTKAMLGEAGIPAYEALIYAGKTKRSLLEDFPSSQFNHVILCVPLEQDTVWLECTSQTNPVGYIGSFTDDRHTLLVTPQGGHLVRTPVMGKEDNLQSRKATVVIDKEGAATIESTTTYRGRQYENDGLYHYLHSGKEDQKEWLYKKLDLPSFIIEDFSFENRPGTIPEADEHLSLQVNNFASVSGKRIFFKPNILNTWTSIPPSVENREQEFIRRLSYVDKDTIHIMLPEGYHSEYLPEPVEISTAFGRYEARVISDETGVRYVRHLEMYQGTYPASTYDAYRDFVKQIVKADKTKIVMLTGT